MPSSSLRAPIQQGPDKPLFSGFIKVWERVTKRSSDAKAIDWHVAGVSGDPPHAVHVFAFDTKRGTVTLINEYAQGPGRLMIGLPAGRVGKKGVLETAQAELSEEVQLKAPDERWHLLGPEPGFAEGKWITAIARGVLALDPEPDDAPGKQDEEEDIEVLRDVSLSRLKELMAEGQLLLASAQTAFMAIAWLQQNGYADVVKQSGW